MKHTGNTVAVSAPFQSDGGLRLEPEARHPLGPLRRLPPPERAPVTNFKRRRLGGGAREEEMHVKCT